MLKASIPYVKRDKIYEAEKSFRVDFPLTPEEIEKGATLTNNVLDHRPTAVEVIDDIQKFSLDTQGFCVIKAKTSLSAEAAFTEPESVKEAYFSEIEKMLLRQFPEYRRIECFEFVTRKRDYRYPSDDFIEVSHEQPASIAHCDYSIKGAFVELHEAFPGQDAYFEGKDFDMLNVWHPLVGPNNDWPLVLCDWSTVDEQNDLLVTTIIHRHRIAENLVLHPNSKHRWYWMPDQQPEDMFIFRCMDSSGKRARCFHCAVDNVNNSGPPRQSLEIRAVAFR